MKKSLLPPLTASILLSTCFVGVSEATNPTSVEAAKQIATLKKNWSSSEYSGAGIPVSQFENLVNAWLEDK